MWTSYLFRLRSDVFSKNPELSPVYARPNIGHDCSNTHEKGFGVSPATLSAMLGFEVFFLVHYLTILM